MKFCKITYVCTSGSCSGDSVDDVACVNGGWDVWSTWSTCTGQRQRTRTCTSPTSSANGVSCSGDGDQTEDCEQATWNEWGTWSSCNNVNIRRERTCPVPSECSGDDFEENSCQNGGWSTWVAWSQCTADVRTRNRDCDNPTPVNGDSCAGDGAEDQTCIDGQWSTWTPWSTCDGPTTRTRTKSCDNPSPSNGGQDCDGVGSDTGSCPTWGAWSAPLMCQQHDGTNYVVRRTRICLNQEAGQSTYMYLILYSKTTIDFFSDIDYWKKYINNIKTPFSHNAAHKYDLKTRYIGV